MELGQAVVVGAGGGPATKEPFVVVLVTVPSVSFSSSVERGHDEVRERGAMETLGADDDPFGGDLRSDEQREPSTKLAERARAATEARRENCAGTGLIEDVLHDELRRPDTGLSRGARNEALEVRIR